MFFWVFCYLYTVMKSGIYAKHGQSSKTLGLCMFKLCQKSQLHSVALVAKVIAKVSHVLFANLFERLTF